MKKLGYNYRLTDIQAALGISQLKKNYEGVKKRNEIKKIQKVFQRNNKISELTDGTLNAHHLFIIN